MSEINKSSTMGVSNLPARSEEDTLRSWRERLLMYLLRIATLAGLIALGASVVADIQIKDWVDIAVTAAAYLLLLGLAFIPMPFRLRAAGFCFLMYAMMMNSLLSSGIRGDAPIFAVAFTVVTLMLLGRRAGWFTLAVLLLSFAAVGALVVTGNYKLKEMYDQLSSTVWIAPAFVILLISMLLMLGVTLLIREFTTVQKRERAAMDDLVREREQLEARVTERTHELALAADVGRSVSQISDLNALLPKAVELIRSQFNLYYAQIYLNDVSGKTLTLRAGTGGVGAELLRRGHRLAVGPGSINGMAASERQAIIVSDTATNPVFKPNSLLPETRSELSMPLLVGERVVGVLDLQSRHPGSLSAENLAVFETLAGQLAIALDNASLFAQTELARKAIEEQARRQTLAGWQEFLNATDRSERIGYLYDQNTLTQYNTQFADSQAENTVKAPIQIAGAPVGKLQLERAGDQPWQSEEVELVTAIVDQASRQLENLRLLAQAESYRSVAEDAARRLTREGWKDYLATRQERSGFSYDQSEVRPLIQGDEASTAEIAGQPEKAVVQPLKIGSEVVGELTFDGIDTLDQTSNELVSAVADLVGDHIDGLRLTEQTQKALIETEQLYSASAELNIARAYDDILKVLRSHTMVGEGAHAVTLSLFNRPWVGDELPESVDTVAAWNELGVEETANRIPTEIFSSRRIKLQADAPTFYEDVLKDSRLHQNERELLYQQYQSRSVIFAPLVAGGQWIGYVAAGYGQPRKFPAEEVRRLVALTGQAAVAINNLRLLDTTQALAQREKNLRQITAMVRGSSNTDTILRTATRELGMVLGRKVKVQLGGADAGGGAKPAQAGSTEK